jgi:predicted dehydrogenase
MAKAAKKAVIGKARKGITHYVLAGCGGRGTSMFGVPLSKDFPGKTSLVGLFDWNTKRMAASAKMIGDPALPQYADFDKMLDELDFDAVAIATRDCSHADYIVRALRAGKTAICEKPLCVSAEQCRQIVRVQKETGGVALVTHNARYGPADTKIYELLREGAIGTIHTISFAEMLDRRHGADYFRRWHRNKSNSGGLLIHKASHHFDQLNWWARGKAEWLVADGGLRFYGARGPYHGPRCSACPHAARCAFYVDLFKNDKTRSLYKDAESEDGYVRDGCVFDPGIDIEDYASVLYRYDNGIQVNYSLHAFSPIEGQIISFEGTDGRLEYTTFADTRWLTANIVVPGYEQLLGESLRLIRPGKGVERIEIPKVEGGHGGADPQTREDFFARKPGDPKAWRMATLEDAVQAVLVGAAANVSLATGRPVNVQELLK